MTLRVAGLVACAVLAFTAPAMAEDLVFDLHNTSDITLTELYVAPAHSDEWGEDILGVDVLAPGESAKVTIADGEETCTYDMSFVGEDGAELTEEGINLCELRAYTLQ